MLVSEMKVGNSGYIAPWSVRLLVSGEGSILYVRRSAEVSWEPSGTQELEIKKMSQGIKVNKATYFQREHLYAGRKPREDNFVLFNLVEKSKDVEWVVGWIEKDQKSEEGRLERIERKVDRLLDSILSKRRG